MPPKPPPVAVRVPATLKVPLLKNEALPFTVIEDPAAREKELEAPTEPPVIVHDELDSSKLLLATKVVDVPREKALLPENMPSEKEREKPSDKVRVPPLTPK